MLAMFTRWLALPPHSFLLLGPRGTRKDHRLRQAGTITVLPLNAFLRRLTDGDVLR